MVFATPDGLPGEAGEIMNCLVSPCIPHIYHFALGPHGTNIEQASRLWTARNGLSEKCSTILCQTPEDAVRRARELPIEQGIGIFWTCAVYYGLYRLFFTESDILPFFITQRMRLDTMQLATRVGLMGEVRGQFPPDWVIATHPSPRPLIEDMGCAIRQVDSNAAAAALCAAGEVALCVTTETARMEYKLETVTTFGSPEMLFLGGIAGPAIPFLREIWRTYQGT